MLSVDKGKIIHIAMVTILVIMIMACVLMALEFLRDMYMSCGALYLPDEEPAWEDRKTPNSHPAFEASRLCDSE